MGKIVMISDKQREFLKENKGILFEFYGQVSNPRGDSKILGNTQVWIYGDDRKDFTPHCHVMEVDKSIEFEVSLVDWQIINVKIGTPTTKMVKKFNKWLNSNSTRDPKQTNKTALYVAWDSDNPENTLYDFVVKHGIDIKDADLKKYVEYQKNLNENG